MAKFFFKFEDEESDRTIPWAKGKTKSAPNIACTARIAMACTAEVVMLKKGFTADWQSLGSLLEVLTRVFELTRGRSKRPWVLAKNCFEIRKNSSDLTSSSIASDFHIWRNSHL